MQVFNHSFMNFLFSFFQTFSQRNQMFFFIFFLIKI